MKRVALALVGLLAIATPAHADLAKLLPIAQARTPASAAVVVGIDVGALARSPVFSGALALVLASHPSVKAGLELVRARCKLEPTTAITGLVAIADARQREGVLFLELGIDQAAANACIDTIARHVLRASPDARIAIKKDGAISELAIDPAYPEPLARSSRERPPTPRDRIHVAWIDRTILAIPLDIDDKPMFARWLGGRGAFKTSRVGKAVATLDKRAAIFAASTVTAHFDTPYPVELGYGALTLPLTSRQGNVLVDLRGALGSRDGATAAVNRANAGLKELIARGRLSANVVAILKSVLISERGNELAIEARVPEAHLLELIVALAR